MKSSIQKKPLVSVGIVAYNEENNIINVLRDIISQDHASYTLKKIFVACGGCTDKTIDRVRSVSDSRIVLIVNPKRQGKAVDEQKIFDQFTDDILVMFDADVRLDGTGVIETLVTTMIENPDVQQVGGNARPFAPKTFFERAVYTTFMVLDLSRGYGNGGHNIYGASGQCIALRKKLVSSIKFPKGIVAEDDYIYFTNKKNGGRFLYSKDAIVYYKLPKTLPDYFKQTLRADPASAIANVDEYFGDMVANEYARPIAFYASAISKSFVWNPIGVVYMICVRIVSRIVGLFTSNHYSLDWFTASSTK